jgi:hypothetical protein
LCCKALCSLLLGTMFCCSFPAGLFHSRLHAGLSRRTAHNYAPPAHHRTVKVYSGTRVDVSRSSCIQVDATNRERRPSSKPVRTQLLWFRSKRPAGATTMTQGNRTFDPPIKSAGNRGRSA